MRNFLRSTIVAMFVLTLYLFEKMKKKRKKRNFVIDDPTDNYLNENDRDWHYFPHETF